MLILYIMSLLNNFEDLCEAQNDTLETKLHRFALKDEHPIITDASKLIGSLYIAPEDKDYDGQYEKLSNLLVQDKIYIILINTITNYTNYTAKQYYDSTDDTLTNSIFCQIGSIEDGWESITSKELAIYFDIYSQLYGEKSKNKLIKSVVNCQYPILSINNYDSDYTLHSDNCGRHITTPISGAPIFKPSYIYINEHPVTISNPYTNDLSVTFDSKYYIF